MVHLDTQIVVWCCEGKTERLSAAALKTIDAEELVVSPMVLLELEYLFEMKRILRPALALLNQLETQIGLKVREHGFSSVMRTALFETWTRDPFDRVIVAHARTDTLATLVTSDAKIRENYARAVW